MKHLFFLFILASFLLSCNQHPDNKNEKPVARVFDKYLYPSDISGVTPSGISVADSASVVKDFIEKWVRNQLMLNKAELNLTDAEKDVDLQIESYRASLLIYAYQQSYLRQKLDTLVTDKEIEDYYNENQPNFVLGESLFKGFFIKVPKTSPEIYKLRQWYRSDNPENIKNLEGYCFNYASVYDHFNEDWVNLDEVLRMIPIGFGATEKSFLSRSYYETRDSNYYYFLNAKKVLPEGTVSPIELVKDDIHYIILNKRKIKLINEMESNIYFDAQNHENFTIYP